MSDEKEENTASAKDGDETTGAQDSVESGRLLACSNNEAVQRDDQENWKIPISTFTNAQEARKQHLNQSDKKKLKKKIKKYYKRQESLIREYTKHYDHEAPVEDGNLDTEDKSKDRMAEICAKVTFAANLLLFTGKLVATVLSGSLAILSSVVDSAVDLISGVVMWCTSSAMKRRDIYKYPSGKKRMEPLAILVLSVIMSMASAMVIVKSAEQIQVYATSKDPSNRPKVDIATIVLICITIVVKLSLFLWMRRYKILSVQALSQDHRNDVISNITALIMGFVGSRYWSFADPLGAIVIAIYILSSWCITAYQQVQMLAGKSADPDFIKKITWIAINHHPDIKEIDTVSVYHFGQNFLAEVDIVLPEDMLVREAHDIQESLQLRLERLDEVERAFVHIDYESEHKREDEHKAI